MKSLTSSVRVLFLITILLLQVGLSRLTLASNSLFDSRTLEATIAELYEIPRGEITDEDLKVIYRAIGEQIAAQKPEVFNDILVHLLADWRQNNLHRPTLEPILESMASAVRAELEEQDSRPIPFSPSTSLGESAGILSIEAIETTMDLFTLAYTFQFGKNLWKSRGFGLSRLELFKNSLRSASTQTLQARGRLAIAGSFAGLVSATSRHLEIRKLSPLAALKQTQKNRVKDLAHRASAISQAYQKKLEAFALDMLLVEVSQLIDECQSLSHQNPELRGALESVLDDLHESLKNIQTIR